MPLSLPADLDQYHPDELKKEAEAFAKSEFRAGADRLIESTPTGAEMKAFTEELQAGPLKGIPPLSLSEIRNLNLEDGEEIMGMIVKNVAEEYGIPTSVDDVEAWVNSGFEQLKDEGKEWLADRALEAAAELGLRSAAENISAKIAPVVGLVTTTAEALEDGQLTQGEAMTIGTTAASTASTVLAGAGAIGVGMVGAVLAPAAIGTAFLESTIAAEEAYRKKVLKMARERVSQESAQINAFLAEKEAEAHDVDRELWALKERAIGGIAQDWSELEHRLGNSFQLRFFPGAPPPLRGGWYYEQPLVGGREYYLKKAACANLSGCLYFPESASYHDFHDTLQYFARMKEEGFALGKERMADDKYYAFSPYQLPQIAQVYGGTPYAYYWRTLRAFDALVPSEKDSAGRAVGFWAHPGHEFRARGQKPFKDYDLLGWDILCRKAPRSCSQLCTWQGPCEIPIETMRQRGRGAVEKSHFDAEMYGVAPWDMAGEAVEYVEEIFSNLQEEFHSVGAYRTRLKGDLIQTASAVRGEKLVRKRLGELAKEVGLKYSGARAGADLDREVKRQVRILDEDTRMSLEVIEKRKKLLNDGALFAGGAVLAVGTAAWYARGRR